MGADLIGFQVTGPRKLTMPKQSEIQEKAKVFDVIEDKSALKKLGYRSEDDILDLETVMNNGIDDEKSLTSFLRNFVQSWPDLGRDSTYRGNVFRKDYVDVFAGEMSWGDTPEGAGYTALNTIQALNLWDMLGLK